jgi:(p)ppGpp synthase/HD superfamily hydrolase
MASNWSQETYVAAYRFAAEAHNDQLFPGTDWPYIVHISMVCMEVLAALSEEQNNDGDLAVQCALLHDTLEDTDVTYDALSARFGEAVADGVEALTKDPSLPKEERMQDSLSRIVQQPKEIGMVKLADRITNLQPPPADWTESKKRLYLDQAREIFEALKHTSPFLSKRISEKMTEYEKMIAAG